MGGIKHTLPHPFFKHAQHTHAAPALPLGDTPNTRALPQMLALNELELIQSHMAQKPVLRGEVGRACVAREVSVERGGMGERGCARH